MAANTYDVGDVVRITGSFAQSGSAVDPSAVTLTYRTPAGALVTLTYGTDAALERTAAGAYRVDLPVTQTGTYQYRWVSTGTGAAAEEGRFIVRPIAVNG